MTGQRHPLDRLADRGHVRGADDVLAAARRAAVRAERRTWVGAAAAAVLIVTAALGAVNVVRDNQGAPSTASCVEEYSPDALTDRAFAFDGTVVEVRTERDPRLPEGEDRVSRAEFRVNEWFAGGSSDAIEVWMEWSVSEGDRLLVTGESRWGSPSLDDAIAWGCGFTTAYSDVRRDEWVAALSDQ